jgi:hypothetical protein
MPLAGYASSVPVTTNPSLSIDGLNFGSFNCSVSKGGIYATPNNCGQIKVGTITSPGVGLQFTSGFTADPLSFDDAAITYHVSSTAGINSVGLDFNGTFWGLAISSVTESVYSGSQLVGFAQVSCGAFVGCNRTDNIMLDGSYNNLYIEKDINVTGDLGIAQASIIDQTFGTDAPEPASLALFGSGLLGLAAWLRRRVKLGNTRKEETLA